MVFFSKLRLKISLGELLVNCKVSKSEEKKLKTVIFLS